MQQLHYPSSRGSAVDARQQHGKFSHLRNMRILCKSFATTGACDVIDCPFSHKCGELRVPGERCRFEVCKMSNCDFFHGTPEQWEHLKRWQNNTFPAPTHYSPLDYLEVKDPHEEAERCPAPSGKDLIAGVRQHLLSQQQGRPNIPPPPPPAVVTATTPVNSQGGTPSSTFLVPSVAHPGVAPHPSTILTPPPHATQVPAANVPLQAQPPAQQAPTGPPPVVQAPRVSVMTANGTVVAWFCGQCNTQNSADLKTCTHCELPPPWNCSSCQFANFGSRSTCVLCRAPHPRLVTVTVSTQQPQPQQSATFLAINQPPPSPQGSTTGLSPAATAFVPK